jgi:hypothetical protein
LAFDENRNRPGVQAMPTAGPGKAKPYDSAAAFRNVMELRARYAQLSTYDEAGTNMSRHMDRRQAQKVQAQLLEAERSFARNGAAATTAKPAPAAAPVVETPALAAAPVVTVPGATDAVGAGAMPAAPIAATDPASEISPEEQSARLRARLLLSQGASRTGRLMGLSSAQLGYRTLIGGAR